MGGNSQEFVLERVGFPHGGFASTSVDGLLLPASLVNSQSCKLGNTLDNSHVPDCKFIVRLPLYFCCTGSPGTVQGDEPVQPIMMHNWRCKDHQMAEWIGLVGTLFSINERSMALYKLCAESVILVRGRLKPGFLIAKPLLLGLW